MIGDSDLSLGSSRESGPAEGLLSRGGDRLEVGRSEGTPPSDFRRFLRGEAPSFLFLRFLAIGTKIEVERLKLA